MPKMPVACRHWWEHVQSTAVSNGAAGPVLAPGTGPGPAPGRGAQQGRRRVSRQLTRYRCGWEGQAASRLSRMVTISSSRLRARLVPKVQVHSRKDRNAHSALCRGRWVGGRGGSPPFAAVCCPPSHQRHPSSSAPCGLTAAAAPVGEGLSTSAASRMPISPVPIQYPAAQQAAQHIRLLTAEGQPGRAPASAAQAADRQAAGSDGGCG